MKNILSIFFLLNIFIMTMNGQTFKYDLQATTIVAQSGNYQLTQGDLNASIEFMEFILSMEIRLENCYKQQIFTNVANYSNYSYHVWTVLPVMSTKAKTVRLWRNSLSVCDNIHMNASVLLLPNLPASEPIFFKKNLQ